MTFKVKDGLSVGANVILDASGNLTVPGKTTLSNTTTAGSSLNLGTGTADPTTPATGDVWNNTGVLKIRQAAATKTVAYTDSTITGNAANVTGTVAIANGGTNGTAVPTAGAVPYGTGTAFAFTAAGTSGQYLTSAGAGVPVWATLPTASTSATAIAITDDVATATAQYLHFGALTTGNDPVKVSSSRLTFVPSTGNLSTIGSVAVGGNGVIFSGSTSGTTTVKASASAGTTTITLPATTGNVVTTGDTGTVTSTMIADGTIANADINAAAAIAVSKLSASTISGITLGNNLVALTISTGLTGTSYNGSTSSTIALATSGVTAATYGSATNIPAITVDTYGRITSAVNTAISIGAATLTAAAGSAGLTNTTVALSFDGTFDANSTVNRTISPVVGPSITALATVMTGATTGVLSKSAADTYSLVTNISTATTLQNARLIQGVSFNGSADITVVTGGTGVNVVGTAVSIGQAVATSSDVRFNSIGVGAAASGTAGTVTGTQFTGNAATVTDGVYLSGTQTISGAKTFTSLSGININSAAPAINFFETDQTLPAGRVKLVYDGALFQLQRNTAAIGDFSTISTDMSISAVGAMTVAGAISAPSFNSITGLSSTTPAAAGTAAVGTGTTVARADHVHPGQTNISGTAGGLSATLVATNGGTGQTAYAVGDILYASTTTALSKLADVATGNSLISGGVGVAPSWGKIGLTTHISGTLAIANGGTGSTTAADALTALGGTTVGVNFFDLVNPSAITFPRINLDNTVSALDAAAFRTAIGAGTSSTTGTVTSVTGTAPVVSSGGNTPAISMAAATSLVNGYMTSTYAAKLDGIAAGATANTGTVTSVTGTAPVTVATGTTTPSISMAAATSTVNGYMTSTYAAKLDGIAAGATTNTGTVTSVAASTTAVSGLSLSGGTITTTGTIGLTGTLAVTASNFASQTAATFLAAPNAIAGAPTFRTIVAADVPTLNQSTTGNAGSATILATARNINGVSFDGSADITVTAAAGTLTGATLASGVTASSLTSVGTLASLSVTGAITAGSVSGRRTQRSNTSASASTVTPDVSAFDVYAFTALAATLTINAPIGTPVDGDRLLFRILDNGTTRTLTWNATYTVIGTILPTATTANKMSYIGCVYNAANTRWDVIAVTTQL